CPDRSGQARPSFTEVFGRSMVDLALERRDLVAITAAMSKGTGLDKLARLQPSRVYDVGIAEQHAVTFAAGLAAGGLVPVVAVYSTFMQRAMDQVLHDVALPNHHVVFALDRSGAVGEDGETHQGFFDIPLFKSLPNSTILAPSCAAEMESFLRFAIDRKGPVFLRFPKARVDCDEPACEAPLVPGRGVFLRKRKKASVLVCALGPLAHAAARATDKLEESGYPIDLYSLRFASPLDEQEIAAVCSGYSAVALVEEGAKAGGVGESIASILARRAVRVKLLILGFGPGLPPQASREELLADAGLDEEGLLTTFGFLAAEVAAERMDETHSILAR
ncbi:MAG: transketolase C-terminal domain-containing protein, partial [Spirochaetales bacterium]|nr:transketolase C-terminal domain-containing protein [Spirochaetales bacterium]